MAPLALAALTTLTGCATNPVPVSDLRAFKPIRWSCETATGDTRAQILKHNSVYATLSSGRRTTYADKCTKGAPTS